MSWTVLNARRGLAPAALLGLALLVGCAPDTPTEPEVAPQFAKGGKKPVGGGGGEATLDEYWVYRGTDGIDRVHMVVSNADAITKSVAHDFFFDGVLDDDAPYDQHYEWNYSGQATPAPTILPDGRAHVDLIFDGARLPDDPYPYVDFLTTSVGGSGADPFVFLVRARRGSNLVGWWVPAGVIQGGQTLGVEESGSFLGAGHDSAVQDVRSYATYQGAEAGGQIWFTTLDLDPTSVQCSTRTVREGKGKNATTSVQTTVSGTVTVAFGRDPDIVPVQAVPGEDYVWWEGHFADGASGTLSTRQTQGTGGTYTVSATMPTGWTGGHVEFITDLLVVATAPDPTDPNPGIYGNYVYNPERNGVLTTAGPNGGAWSNAAPSTSVGDGRFPVAHSNGVDVVCR